MSTDTRFWTVAEFRRAAIDGPGPVAAIESVLHLLDDAPASVLIGGPLHQLAIEDAKALEGRDGEHLPLYGVPVVVKDNIDVAGHVTTAGCPGYAYVAERDATLVARLRAAGAVIVGKTNMDQFATGLVGTRSPFGTPRNTLDPALVPGGSSSGSAVAVALGLVPIAIGTDTAGSGRVPAALNGIVGFKPTLGRVSLAGIVPAVRRFDCPSVFARSVDDAALVAHLMSGHDISDPFSRRPPRPVRSTPVGVVGVPREWPSSLGVTPEMEAWFAAAVEQLASVGVEIRPIDITPLLELGSLLYGSAIVAERTAVVGDAVTAQLEGLDPVVASIIDAGRGYSAVDAFRADHELMRRRAVASPVWDGIDAIATPTTPAVTTVDAVRADPIGENSMLGRLTTFVNLADTMCVVVPIRPGGVGVPAGLQLVGRAWDDERITTLASAFEARSA